MLTERQDIQQKIGQLVDKKVGMKEKVVVGQTVKMTLTKENRVGFMSLGKERF